MRREMIAAFLSLFLAFAEVFNFKDLEAPALMASYCPQVKKHDSRAVVGRSMPVASKPSS
ncbi:MAG: hypothetical protein ACREAY_06305 [Nitrososphaera sp.]|uniref:hypothetical protein n=1 Tax=Nitrososphaera sp. TaxID=1971748 RepID=UPI003D6F920E